MKAERVNKHAQNKALRILVERDLKAQIIFVKVGRVRGRASPTLPVLILSLIIFGSLRNLVLPLAIISYAVTMPVESKSDFRHTNHIFSKM